MTMPTHRIRMTIDMPLCCGGGAPAYATDHALEVIDGVRKALSGHHDDNWRVGASLREMTITGFTAYPAIQPREG